MKTRIAISALLLGLFSVVSVQAQDKDGDAMKDHEGMDMGHNDAMAKSYVCPMHPEMTSDKAGTCPKCGMALAEQKMDMGQGQAAKAYTCSMHPEVTSNTPGACPKCGMALVEKKMDMKMDMGHSKADKTYTCPMHADVSSDKPGDCPKCGMALKEKVIDPK